MDRVVTKAALLRQSRAPLEVVVHAGRKKKVQEDQPSMPSSPAAALPTKGLNLKNTRFEIMKFAMSSYKSQEKEDAKVALAIKLGAIPHKSKYVNYKELKNDKNKERMEAKNSEKMQTLGKILKKSGRKHSQTMLPGKRGSTGILGQYGKVSKVFVTPHLFL